MNGQETLPLCFLLDLNGAHINSSMFQPHYYQPNVVQTIVSARLHSSKKRIACKVLIASRQTEWFPAIFPPSVERLVVWLKYLICKKGNCEYLQCFLCNRYQDIGSTFSNLPFELNKCMVYCRVNPMSWHLEAHIYTTACMRLLLGHV